MPRREPVDVAQALDDVAQRAGQGHPRREVVRDVAADLPRPRLDPALLDRVLETLVDKAMKYSTPDGAVCLVARREATEVVLAVQDDGPGIPPEDLPRIFDPFFRAARGQQCRRLRARPFHLPRAGRSDGRTHHQGKLDRSGLSEAPSPLVITGALEFDLEHRPARLAGAELSLTRREWDLLAALARDLGKVVTQRRLLTDVRGRRKPVPADPCRAPGGKLSEAARLLRTEPGVGYRLLDAG